MERTFWRKLGFGMIGTVIVLPSCLSHARIDYEKEYKVKEQGGQSYKFVFPDNYYNEEERIEEESKEHYSVPIIPFYQTAV